VVSNSGEQLGVMPTERAIELAQSEGFDLVEVSPTSRPPVCRIMDYGKYKYEKNKRAKMSKKRQHMVHVKEIKLRPKTEEHDFQFKKKHAEEFLAKHNKVKFTVFFRGREFDHQELGHRILGRMRDELAHVGTVERAPQFEGRLMTMIMSPLPAKPGQAPKPAGAPADRSRGVPSESATGKPDGRPAQAIQESPSDEAPQTEDNGSEREDQDAEA
jgi:translation initiation factor IF-3